ncbi:MAG: hypothetical protein MAG431_02387 [Chloroflexi bacterium]|nr:hypothetical protein [Chloroflexota bacterium]
MREKKYRFSDGEVGAALAIRIIPRARNNELVEVLHDGTIKVRLVDPGANLNEELISFLADVLALPVERLNVVAGKTKRDKLVSVLDLDPEDVHKKILANLAS